MESHDSSLVMLLVPVQKEIDNRAITAACRPAGSVDLEEQAEVVRTMPREVNS